MSFIVNVLASLFVDPISRIIKSIFRKLKPNSAERKSGDKTHYELLFVHPEAPDEVIKGAYEKLIISHFHENTADNIDKDKLKSLSAAYEILSSAEKRKQYDKQLEDAKTDEKNKVDREKQEIEEQTIKEYADEKLQKENKEVKKKRDIWKFSFWLAVMLLTIVGIPNIEWIPRGIFIDSLILCFQFISALATLFFLMNICVNFKANTGCITSLVAFLIIVAIIVFLIILNHRHRSVDSVSAMLSYLPTG